MTIPVCVVPQLNESSPPDLHDPPMTLNYEHTLDIVAKVIIRVTNASHNVQKNKHTSINTTVPPERQAHINIHQTSYSEEVGNRRTPLCSISSRGYVKTKHATSTMGDRKYAEQSREQRAASTTSYDTPFLKLRASTHKYVLRPPYTARNILSFPAHGPVKNTYHISDRPHVSKGDFHGGSKMFPRTGGAIYTVVVVVGPSVGSGIMTDSSTRGCLAVSDICACSCLRCRFSTSITLITLASMKSEPTTMSATTPFLRDDSSISATTMGTRDGGGRGGGRGLLGGGDNVNVRSFIDVYPTLPRMMSQKEQSSTQYVKSQIRIGDRAKNGTRYKVLIGQ